AGLCTRHSALSWLLSASGCSLLAFATIRGSAHAAADHAFELCFPADDDAAPATDVATAPGGSLSHAGPGAHNLWQHVSHADDACCPFLDHRNDACRSHGDFAAGRSARSCAGAGSRSAAQYESSAARAPAATGIPSSHAVRAGDPSDANAGSASATLVANECCSGEDTEAGHTEPRPDVALHG